MKDFLRLYFVLLVFSLFAFPLPAFAQAAQHGIALHGAVKYPPTFDHFDYARPDAPKGGELRMATIGTFDNLNPFILKGVAAAGTTMVFDTLMESALDEPFSQYGLIAESVTVAPDRSWVSYKIRPQARFHDGSPVQPEDVIFSFETLRSKGHPSYRTYYKDVARAEKTGPQEVRFTFATAGNAELPLIMGQLPVLSQKAWKGRDFAATTLSPVDGSGPYKIESVNAGRDISYRKVANWWAADLPVAKGRYNFEVIRIDYYRDITVALEAFLAGRYDVRIEQSAKNWALSYTSPAVKNGQIVKREYKNELPSGMQGFVFNTRRPLFKDARVREALTLAFDFEWGNKNVAFNAYKRTNSYFANSELAATGLPSPEELALLEPLRGQIPDEVFTKTYQPPKTDGSGNNRENLRRAAALLEAAGWTLKDGKLINAKGEAFTFEIVESSPLFERWVQPFLRNLERLGIRASYRVVDSAQYQSLINDFNFDMTVHVFGQSLSPGNEQRDFWGSNKVDQKGSRNLIGVNSKAVDTLVEAIVKAKDRKALVTATRALDRVLLWNHFVIPHWNFGAYRLSFWDRFGQPDIAPPYGLDYTSLWWVDPVRAAKIDALRNKR